MEAETYLTAARAQELGFVDEITGRGADPEKTKAQVKQLANLVKRPEAKEVPKVLERGSDLLHRQRELLLTKIKVLS